MIKVDPDSYNVDIGHKHLKQNWQLFIGPKFIINQVYAPNFFHRLLQYLFLSIKWKKEY
jgi:hypothetical protein